MKRSERGFWKITAWALGISVLLGCGLAEDLLWELDASDPPAYEEGWEDDFNQTLPAEGDTPRFEPADCFYDVSDLEVEMACGFLVVPEDRDIPADGFVQLPVAILYSKGQTKNRPPLQ